MDGLAVLLNENECFQVLEVGVLMLKWMPRNLTENSFRTSHFYTGGHLATTPRLAA